MLWFLWQAGRLWAGKAGETSMKIVFKTVFGDDKANRNKYSAKWWVCLGSEGWYRAPGNLHILNY